jgi:indole-3-glycerol phosphate synthase
MTDILQRIVARKRLALAAAQAACAEPEIRRRAADAPTARGFLAALRATSEVRLIAEIKRQSPSAGLIREDFDPVLLGSAYQRGGAACLSVLTEEPHFGGHLDYLASVRQAVALPLLRKDFLFDPYQVYEARAAGADAILLIAECLGRSELAELYSLSSELGMDTLIELHDPARLSDVLSTGCPLVGVNNRDLQTFHVDLEQTIRVRERVPADRLLVGESGIHTVADVARLGAAGVKAVLVGESLMRQRDVAAAARALTGQPYTPHAS